jgi:hypothetical protein
MPDKKPTIPVIRLLENAYAANKPTQELMMEFNKQIDILSNEGQLTDEEVLLMRTNDMIGKMLAEETLNDSKKITEDHIF